MECDTFLGVRLFPKNVKQTAKTEKTELNELNKRVVKYLRMTFLLTSHLLIVLLIYVQNFVTRTRHEHTHIFRKWSTTDNG